MTYPPTPEQPGLPDFRPASAPPGGYGPAGYGSGPYGPPPGQFYMAPPPTAPPGRGLRGPHAAIWITVIVCATVIFVCMIPCLMCGGMGVLGSFLPDATPTPTP